MGRSLGHLIKTINTPKKSQIDFWSLTENIDTGASGWQTNLPHLGSLPNFEHPLMSERTRAGMQVAKRSGQRLADRPGLCAEPKQIRNDLVVAELGPALSHTNPPFRSAFRFVYDAVSL
ncbi:recombinase family protein [Mesorhizobium soli]|uniref:recombinase family protein n=1 Tax=Pseudaminobacter soli (ex Li et al. 2025) TaxID=1295366 RepID=UPI0015E697F4